MTTYEIEITNRWEVNPVVKSGRNFVVVLCLSLCYCYARIEHNT